MELSWSVLAFLVLAIDPSPCPSIAEARKVDGRELAVGCWNVTLRSSVHQYGVVSSTRFPLHFFFPPKEQAVFVNDVSSIPAQREAMGRRYNPLFRAIPRISELLPLRRSRHRIMDCNLFVFHNGTFLLEPDLHSQTPKPSFFRGIGFSRGQEVFGPTSTIHQKKDDELLVMHGRWKIFRNPYCSTDRFHDILQFRSYPRSAEKKSCLETRRHDDVWVPQQSFIWQSHLLGHYTQRNNRVNGRPARMIKGVCLLNLENQNNEAVSNARVAKSALSRQRLSIPSRRRVVAQFTARKWTPYVDTTTTKKNENNSP